MTELRLPVVAGGLMVLAGTLALLHAVGVLPGGVPIGPLVVLGAGAWLLSAGLRSERSAPSADAADPVAVAVPLDGATAARLVLSHGAGTIRMAGGATAGHLVEGTSSSIVQTTKTHRDGRLEATLQPTGTWEQWPGRRAAVVWDLGLARDVPIDLEVRTGASQVRLDLADALVRSLKVQTGASDVEVVLPAHGRCNVSVSAGAADVRIRVPEGVAASVRNRSALAGFTIDEHRFPKVDGRYESPGFDRADDRADIDIDGGVASFSVR